MSHKFCLLPEGALVIRCDDVIDTWYGFGSFASIDEAHERSVVNKLTERFFPGNFDTLDLRTGTDDTNDLSVDRIVNACLDAKHQRILLTVNPNDAKILAEALAVIARTHGKTFSIAAVSIPALLRNSDVDFVLGLAVGALCSNTEGVFIASLPSVLSQEKSLNESFEDEEPEEVTKKEAGPVDTETWLYKNGKCEENPAIIRDENQSESSLTRWLAPQQVEKQEEGEEDVSPVFSRYFTTLSSEPEMWLSNPNHPSESTLGGDEVDFIMASKVARSLSTRSCDLVPDIEELVYCSAAAVDNPNHHSTGSSLASTPQSQARSNASSSSSSWLRVICRASEPCANISECMCEPNCSAVLLSNQDQSAHQFATSSKWLKRGSVEIDPFDDNEDEADQWLARRSESKKQWLLSKQQNRKLFFNDDGLTSDEAKWTCFVSE